MSNLTLTPLASGSKGNANLLSWGEKNDNHILIDCGIRIKAIEKTLLMQNLEPTQISAIIVTHAHGDHISGVAPLARKYNIPTYMTKGTSKFADLKGVPLQDFQIGVPFNINGLTLNPFTVPHDARETCAFTFYEEGFEDTKLGYLTDCGHITPHIEDMLADVKALAVEANHCRDMLMDGHYPYALKKRVSSDLGHLSNEQTAKLLTKISNGLTKVHLLHLSEENNCPIKAKNICFKALNNPNAEIVVAMQNNPAPPLTLKGI
jgi:phosphoribosyl 1,2-cyclic phosphodiesterase